MSLVGGLQTLSPPPRAAPPPGEIVGAPRPPGSATEMPSAWSSLLCLPHPGRSKGWSSGHSPTLFPGSTEKGWNGGPWCAALGQLCMLEGDCFLQEWSRSQQSCCPTLRVSKTAFFIPTSFPEYQAEGRKSLTIPQHLVQNTTSERIAQTKPTPAQTPPAAPLLSDVCNTWAPHMSCLS